MMLFIDGMDDANGLDSTYRSQNDIIVSLKRKLVYF